ncbi:MAG: tripartite tricarboxylate transporter substrate binding protein [Variovorax sp.]|nr:MAG: tripartite tricarboxylate transporter substrate binding protein [Variovorax sp.]
MLGALALATACLSASAQDYPGRAVRLIVPFPPGGGTDIIARPIAQKLAEKWGQPVVVDNRGGAGGNVGTKAAADAAPDGYTLILGVQGTHAVNQSLYANAGFDSSRDFAAITMIANTPNILVVHPSVRANSVAELIALAKAEPGRLNYATPGNGTPSHLATEMFKRMAGIEMTHVPYKGSGPALADMLGGQTQVWIANAPVVLPHIKTGKLRALATTSARRPAVAADLPTLAEAGLKGYEADTWYGLFAPARTPRPILDKIHADVVAVLQSPEIREAFAPQGAEVVGNSQEVFTRQLADDIAKWKKVIAELKLRID